MGGSGVRALLLDLLSSREPPTPEFLQRKFLPLPDALSARPGRPGAARGQLAARRLGRRLRERWAPSTRVRTHPRIDGVGSARLRARHLRRPCPGDCPREGRGPSALAWSSPTPRAPGRGGGARPRDPAATPLWLSRLQARKCGRQSRATFERARPVRARRNKGRRAPPAGWTERYHGDCHRPPARRGLG